MFTIFIVTQNIKIIRNISTQMTVSSAKAQIFPPMIVGNRRMRQLRANCPLYDDLISEVSNLFSKIDLSIFDEPFLEEVEPVDFLQQVKRDINLGC